MKQFVWKADLFIQDVFDIIGLNTIPGIISTEEAITGFIRAAEGALFRCLGAECLNVRMAGQDGWTAVSGGMLDLYGKEGCGCA